MTKLVEQWLEAKQAEDDAKKRRVEIESELINFCETKENGSKTTEIGNYKVTVTRKLNYSFDLNAWESARDRVPAELHPVKTKIELDVKKYEALPSDMFYTVAECVTVKEGKPGFKVVHNG